jgi:DHA1 family inner membrane transport protein
LLKSGRWSALLALALGAVAIGVVIAAGLGYRAPSRIGAGPGVAGLAPAATSFALDRRQASSAAASPAGAPV